MTQKNTTSCIKASLIISLVILIISIIILSLVPPVSKDALVHHLAVPKLYLERGEIYEIPFMDFSYYPMNLDLLYMIPLHFGNDIAAKLMHFAFAILTGWLIFYYLRHRTTSIYGLIGALFFLSIPIIVKLSITVYVDLGEIFFSFAALLLILKWLNSAFKSKFLIYSGIMCGLALGTKYNGLVTLVILTLFVPFLYSRHGIKKSPGLLRPAVYGMTFLVVSLLVFSPWMIRNYHWKSNPVYPLYDEFFNPGDNIINDAISIKQSVIPGLTEPAPYSIRGNSGLFWSHVFAGMTQPALTNVAMYGKEMANSDDIDSEYLNINRGIFIYRRAIYNETGWEIALLPVRIFFQGKDGDPQYFDGRLNPFLLILPFFAFFRMRDDGLEIKREKKIMLAFSLLFFGFAFFSTALRIRYIGPMIPPLVVLSVFGIKKFFNMLTSYRMRFAGAASKALIALLVVFCLGLNASYIMGQYKYVEPLPFITGQVSRDEYISRYVPEYPALIYINDSLDSRAKVLFIFLGKRGYYCNREYIFDMEMLKELINDSRGPAHILTGLRDREITHLLVNERLFERWVKDNFGEDKQALVREFFREDVELLFYRNGFGVMSLAGNCHIIPEDSS
jgi:4-amino-4-deoxy-L-arabinose transferase-like glycosyltransferase